MKGRKTGVGEDALKPKPTKPKRKAKIIRWRGVLDTTPAYLRRMVAVVLAVAGASLTFTQLGFISITMPDGTVGYVVVLMQVVALSALLLGTLSGVGIGLFAGAVLFAHAQVFPLDHYELAFVTPVSSIVMFGITGLFFGVLFAFVLRNDPGPIKRVIYIAIVCGVVSWLYSIGFALSVLSSLFVEIFEKFGNSVNESAVRLMAIDTARHLGSTVLQARVTALITAIICCAIDFVARRAKSRQGSLRLRAVFGAWLSVVVALAFMTMSAMSFAGITEGELYDANNAMESELNYLCTQFEYSDERSNLTTKLFEDVDLDSLELDDEFVERIGEAYSDESILRGYTLQEDGTVIFAVDGVIYASNDPQITPGESIDKVFGSDVADAVNLSLENEQMERFVFDGVGSQENDFEQALETKIRSQIAYLLAKRPQVSSFEGESQVVVMIQTSDHVFRDRPSVMMWMTASALGLLLAVFLIVSQLIYRVVTRRIEEENEALLRITAGNLDTRAEAGGTLEFDSLSEGINTTVSALRGWIAEAETRMDAELATAKAIQESALPRIFPPYPDIQRFDIYASMNAAREVGGDFYDFFLVGDSGPHAGKLGFVIADVSGKGVPAALFMMKAKTQIRDYLESGMEVGEAVENANRQLVDGNDAGMFVTAWVGVLDYATGHVDYVNAGHNPPLLWQRKGGWQWMRKKSGPILGLFDMPYCAHSVECQAGDTFLLYTDGVTEALNMDEELYGEERLFAVAEAGFRLHPRELLESVRADVAAYVQEAEQSDDITILALEVGVPPEVTATIEIPARTKELERVNEFLHAELERRLCPLRAQNQLDIAVEELFVNVCNYAYPNATPDKPGHVRIQRTYTAEPASITVDIIDEGVPYNPLEKPDAVMPDNIEDVPIGGLGILMAKRCTDEMHYERTDGCNVVTIVKRW